MSKFVHMELNTSDPEAAQKFYKAIFGWKYNKMKMADGSVYVGFTGDGDGIGGGIQKNPNPDTPPHWIGYAGVPSIKKAIAKVEKNGGKVLMPEMPIDQMGSIAIFADPQGAVFAMWQPAAPAKQAAPEEAAPAKAGKKTAKKAGGKKAATQQAAPEQAAPEQAAPAKAGKKTAKKAGGKKAAKQEAAAPEPAAPEAAPAKAGKKAAKKQAAAPEQPAKKKTAKKKTTKKG